MNDVQLIEQLSVTDAYAPNTDMPAAAWTHEEAFAEIELLIGEHASAGVRHRTGMLVAAASFAIVLIAGIVLFATLVARPEAEPATTLAPTTTTIEAPTITTGPTTPAQPTTTTSAPPAADADAVGYMEALVAEVNAGDGEAAAERVMSAVSFIGPWFWGDEGHNDERPILASHLRLWAALDSSLALEECATLSNGITRCVVSRTSEHDPFHPNTLRAIWQLRVDGETLTFMSYDADLSDPSWAVQDEFERWLNTVDRDAFNALIAVEDAAATAEIQKQYVAQWRAEQNGDS